MMVSLTTQCGATIGCRTRRAFTLVELLVVIAIIGVLVALLVPAVSMARANVQEAAITTEVAQLSTALQSFKTQYGVDFPPDFVIYQQRVMQVGGQEVEQEVTQFLSRIFRYRNRQTDIPRNPVFNGGVYYEASVPTTISNPQVTFETLDPAETLYLWLRGFSNDPENPLFGTPAPPGQDTQKIWNSDERTPLFPFDVSRVEDRDRDGFSEYYPRYGGERPYVYLNSARYERSFVQRDDPNDTRRTILFSPQPLPTNLPTELPAVPPMVHPRPMANIALMGPAATLNLADAVANRQNFAAADTFQIMAAGLDNSFGENDQLGVLTEEQRDLELTVAFPAGPYLKQARDNITNFAEGTLEDAQP